MQNKKSLLKSHNLLTLKNHDMKEIEVQRRKLLRNYTLASKAELEALKDVYKPENLKENFISYDSEEEKNDHILAFRRIVKNVVATMNQKDRRLDYHQKPILYT